METREMKRLTILGMAALMAAAVSCKKSGDDAPAPVQGAFRAVAEAQADDSKTSLNGLNVLWSSGDQIKVYNSTKGDVSGIFALGSGVGSSSGEFNEPVGITSDFYTGHYRAFYPAAISSSNNDGVFYMTLQSKQAYAANSFGKDANPMVAEAESTSLTFSNLCGTLRLSLTGNRSGMKVTSIKVTSRKEERLQGKGTVVFAGGTASLSMQGAFTAGENSVELTCPSVELPVYTGQPGVDVGAQFNIVLPAGSLKGGFDIEVEFNTPYGSKGFFTKGVGGMVDNSIEAGHVRNMPALRVDCGFVVNDSGKTVEFAQGNLYYEPEHTETVNGETVTVAAMWGIEPRQWMYDAGEVVDGTGSVTGLTHLSYFKWSNIESEVTDQTNDAPTTSSTFFTEPGGLTIGDITYHTLSKAEWDYVVGTRPVRFHHGWAKVYMRPTKTGDTQLADVAGLLLFPAEWTEPTTEGYTPLTNAFEAGSLWTPNTNVVNEADLLSGGTYYGCVFLPCAGGRNSTSVHFVGMYGHYWSSSPRDSNAWLMRFNSDIVSMDSDTRSFGFTVRPVHVLGNN